MALGPHEDACPGDLSADMPSEDLFIKLYRCAMLGLTFGDTTSWRLGRHLLARNVPEQDLGALFGQFYGFARAVIAASRGAPSCRPVSFREISAGEALALRMIETSQRGDSAGMVSAGAALVAGGDLGDVLQSAQSLARALGACGLFIGSVSAVAEAPDATGRIWRSAGL